MHGVGPEPHGREVHRAEHDQRPRRRRPRACGSCRRACRSSDLPALACGGGLGARRLSFGGGASTMAAWAARRAAAMKFDLPAGSGMTGGRTFSSAASEAAMRSAGELPRPRPAPGSSGWSGGRSGSIGRRSSGRRRIHARRRPAASGADSVAEHGRLRWARPAGSAARPAADRAGSERRDRRHIGVRRTGCGAAPAPGLSAARALRRAAHAGLDRGQPVDHMAERAVHRFERILRALDVALERIGFGAFEPPRGGDMR